MIKTILAFVAAIVVAYLLISIMGAQYVIADIQSYGIAVSLSDRVAASWHDIQGLIPVMIILVSAAFLVSFLIAALGSRFLGGNRRNWYLAAGASSLPATMLLMKAAIGITPFAAAGSGFGLLLISVCGLGGAWVFTRLTQKKEA